MKKVILGLLAIVALGSCSEQKSDGGKAPTRVETEIVSLSSGSNSQTYVGIVEEREATAVSFTGMGVVKRVLVSEGQAVSRGQLLAEMDDTQARNLLSGAEAQMAQANDALERYTMLHDNGSLPEVQWVEIQSKVAQAKSQLEVAKKNLADCRLVAPVSGIVGRKQIGAGETALPSQAVVTILDISSVKVKVAVPETEIGSIAANTPTSIKVDAIGQSFSGARIEKGVTADAMTHTYDVRINVQNPERQLLPGMVASVQFKASPSPSQGGDVQIPVTAVQKNADGALFVWVVGEDSTAHRTAVTIGSTQGRSATKETLGLSKNRIAVTSGISEGERIVTEGYQKLSEGTRVVF
ncbi:MAG: efflux RND transporter periplasmic adaptor subunit [Prevotella sp.]|nr:efflux RND transporter periplasmic adaptor subunit [Prevotella sp.]